MIRPGVMVFFILFLFYCISVLCIEFHVCKTCNRGQTDEFRGRFRVVLELCRFRVLIIRDGMIRDATSSFRLHGGERSVTQKTSGSG